MGRGLPRQVLHRHLTIGFFTDCNVQILAVHCPYERPGEAIILIQRGARESVRSMGLVEPTTQLGRSVPRYAVVSPQSLALAEIEKSLIRLTKPVDRALSKLFHDCPQTRPLFVYSKGLLPIGLTKSFSATRESHLGPSIQMLAWHRTRTTHCYSSDSVEIR
jgi:hypothetical protein